MRGMPCAVATASGPVLPHSRRRRRPPRRRMRLSARRLGATWSPSCSTGYVHTNPASTKPYSTAPALWTSCTSRRATPTAWPAGLRRISIPVPKPSALSAMPRWSLQSVKECYRGRNVRVFRLDREGTINRLRERARSLLEQRPDVLEVRLFGSLASGTPRPGSDADLFVVLRDSAPAFLDRIPDIARYFEGV